MNIPHRKIIHHSAEFWQEQINNWQASGLKQTEYCQQNGLAISTFHKWQKKLRDKTKLNLKLPEAFIELPTESLHHPEPKAQWDIELLRNRQLIPPMI